MQYGLYGGLVAYTIIWSSYVRILLTMCDSRFTAYTSVWAIVCAVQAGESGGNGLASPGEGNTTGLPMDTVQAWRPPGAGRYIGRQDQEQDATDGCPVTSDFVKSQEEAWERLEPRGAAIFTA